MTASPTASAGRDKTGSAVHPAIGAGLAGLLTPIIAGSVARTVPTIARGQVCAPEQGAKEDEDEDDRH